MSENEKAKKISKKKIWIPVVCIVLVVAIVLGVIVYFATKPKKPADNQQNPSVNATGIHAYLIAEGEKCGYTNAFSELSEDWVTKSSDLTYTRFQQNYKGIPVYGQTVVCVTDKDENVVSVTGNVEDINEEISTTPTVKKEDVDEKIKTYLSENYSITDAEFKYDLTEQNLCIYSLYDYADTLCYDLDVEFVLSEGTANIQMIINATDGSIICFDDGVIYKTVTGEVAGDVDTERKYNITYTDDNGTYKLIDPDRNITAYFSDHEVKQGLFVFSGGDLVVTWNSQTNVDQDSLNAYANTQIVYDYFKEVLNVKSYDGNGETPIVIYTDVDYVHANNKYNPLVNNACYVQDYLLFGKYTDETKNNSNLLDTVAHEYMHGVEGHRSGMNGDGESGAIKEALSDIFGELVEIWYKEKQGVDVSNHEWEHSDIRSLGSPAESNDPDYNYAQTYYGENWADVYSSFDDGGVHLNSTVISHSAYLMWKNGLTTEELSKLWYNAMIMMPKDCNFYECRELVELAARNLGFSEDKLSVIYDAFDAVDIETDNTVEEIEIKSGCQINILDFEGYAYNDYIISVWHLDVNGKYPKTSNPLRKFVLNEKYIGVTDPYVANLDEGGYVMKLTDKKVDINGQQRTIYKYLLVTDNGKDKVDIDAKFGLISITGKVTDVDDNPVEDATVRLCYDDGEEKYNYYAHTYSNGKYKLEKIPYASYTEIYAQKDELQSEAVDASELKKENTIDLKLGVEFDYDLILPYLELFYSCENRYFGMKLDNDGEFDYFGIAKTRDDALNKNFYKVVTSDEFYSNNYGNFYGMLEEATNFETEDECFENLENHFTGDTYDYVMGLNKTNGTYMYNGKLYHVCSSMWGLGSPSKIVYETAKWTKQSDTEYVVTVQAGYYSYDYTWTFNFVLEDGVWKITNHKCVAN